MNRKLGLALAVGVAAVAVPGAQALAAPASGATNWTGPYLGLYAGGAGSSTNMQEVNGPGELAFLPGQLTRTNLNPGSFVYGGLAGYNYQIPSGRVVIGAELEFGGDTGSATGITNSGVIPGAPPIEDNIPTYNKLTLPWTFRARVRLGYAFGDVLPFVAAGVSVTQAQLGLTFPCPNFPSPGTTVYTTSSSKTVTGFNIGAGVDWAITGHLVSRAEYVFDGYGAPTFLENGSQGWNNRRLSDLQSNTLRVSLAYKF
jgi:outer membrane immunogenic protein